MTGATIAGETIAETIAETLPAADSVTNMASLWGVEIYVILSLLLIDLIIAVSVCLFSSKLEGDLSKVLCALISPAIALVAVLFGGDDDYRVRIVIVAIVLLGYSVFYLLAKAVLSHIDKNKKEVLENKDSQYSIILPIGKEHIIDKRFIDELPANVAALIHVSEEIRIWTNRFITSFSKLTDDDKRHESLRGYFLGICYHLATLFSIDTRVHVRILQDAKYQKYISTYAFPSNKKEDPQTMKDMSLNNKMIAESFSNSCSLIKLLNPELHEEGSRNKWKNYLMFSLPQITHDGKPVFTMGISVTRKINERFYFLNYCAIEAIIGRYIESILENPKCDLADFVERYYFKKH